MNTLKMARTKTNPNPKQTTRTTLLTKVAKYYLPCAVAKRQRQGITDLQAEKARYFDLSNKSKERATVQEKLESTSNNEVVSGDTVKFLQCKSHKKPLPTCTRCNFDWVRMDIQFARDEQLCDTCMNQCLAKTWIVKGRKFDTQLDAMAHKYANKTVFI